MPTCSFQLHDHADVGRGLRSSKTRQECAEVVSVKDRFAGIQSIAAKLCPRDIQLASMCCIGKVSVWLKAGLLPHDIAEHRFDGAHLRFPLAFARRFAASRNLDVIDRLGTFGRLLGLLLIEKGLQADYHLIRRATLFAVLDVRDRGLGAPNCRRYRCLRHA